MIHRAVIPLLINWPENRGKCAENDKIPSTSLFLLFSRHPFLSHGVQHPADNILIDERRLRALCRHSWWRWLTTVKDDLCNDWLRRMRHFPLGQLRLSWVIITYLGDNRVIFFQFLEASRTILQLLGNVVKWNKKEKKGVWWFSFRQSISNKEPFVSHRTIALAF